MNAPDSWRPLEDFEKEADELIAYGDFSINDIIDALKNAQPHERRALCLYIGSDNCSAGIELHRLLRDELIRKLGR